jgi:hypothetical protein
VDFSGGGEFGEEGGGAATHEGDTFPAVAAGEDRLPVGRAAGGDGVGREVAGDGGRVQAADVDQEWGVAAGAEAIGDEGVFGALGVEGAEDGDGGHG